MECPRDGEHTIVTLAPFGEQILDVAVAEVEAMVKPGRVPDDGGWETVPLIGVGGSVHAGMVAQARLI